MGKFFLPPRVSEIVEKWFPKFVAKFILCLWAGFAVEVS